MLFLPLYGQETTAQRSQSLVTGGHIYTAKCQHREQTQISLALMPIFVEKKDQPKLYLGLHSQAQVREGMEEGREEPTSQVLL